MESQELNHPFIEDRNDHNHDWIFPLILSCLAGASTSIGACIVFVVSPAVIQNSMAFSLSLAASVMITVSVISIGPECLRGLVLLDDETGSIRLIQTGQLVQRCVCFGLGCFSYWLLSKLLIQLPEPESFLTTSHNSPTSKAADGNVRPLLSSSGDIEDTTGITGTGSILNQQQVENGHGSPLLIPRTDPMTTSTTTTISSTPTNDAPTRTHVGGAVRRAAASATAYRELSHSSSTGSLPSMTSHGSTNNNNNNNNSRNDDSNDEKRKLRLRQNGSSSSSDDRRRSWRVAMLLFVSLLCHNFPEGLAVVASTVESKELGVTVAIGIMIHNIPEGIAIAVPCMAARPDAPWLAFWLATLSGIAEPLGAALALVVLRSSSSRNIHLPLENILACVAGIMCMVAVVELYPEALNHVRHKNYKGIIGGTLAGMFIMVATEWYLP